MGCANSTLPIFGIGIYDGFLGPGTGSFWAMAYVLMLGFNLTKATAHTKLMNFTSNAVALAGFALAGQVQLASMGLPPAMPYVKSGRLRVIAVTSAARSLLLPDAPTVAETGLPGYEVNSWYGLLAPAGTPREIVTRLNTEVSRALREPDARERLYSIGAEPMNNTPEEFQAYINAEMAKWSKVVKTANIKAE